MTLFLIIWSAHFLQFSSLQKTCQYFFRRCPLLGYSRVATYSDFCCTVYFEPYDSYWYRVCISHFVRSYFYYYQASHGIMLNRIPGTYDSFGVYTRFGKCIVIAILIAIGIRYLFITLEFNIYYAEWLREVINHTQLHPTSWCVDIETEQRHQR